MDNFNGPIGMLVACGIGIFRTSYGEPNIISDFVPVDVLVRAMLIATYRKGTEDRLVKYNITKYYFKYPLYLYLILLEIMMNRNWK